MTPLADIGAYGEELYQQVLPLHGPDPDGLAHDLVGAWARPMLALDLLIRDTADGPGWSIVLDVAAVPAEGLVWLSQLAGVVLRKPRDGETLEDWAVYARMAIVEQGGRQRGTPAAIVSAVRDTLTGLRSVRLIERAAGNPWALTLITRTTETPDAAATVAAALTQKPAGIVLTHVISDDPLWVETTKTWAGVGAGEHWNTLAIGDV